MGELSVLCPGKHDTGFVITPGASDAFSVLVQPGLKRIWANQDVADI